MSKVLVLGASGFLGLAVARKFVEDGYTVYGLTRSAEKGKILAQNEIIPVIGTGKDYASWEEFALLADIIVEAIADYQDYSTPAIVAKHLSTLAASNKNKVLIYTSGVWIYGDTTGKHLVDESSPVNPPPIVQSRPGIEKIYLDAGAIVFRPGCLYGRSGSLTGAVFGGLTAGKAQFAGTGEQYWSWVHVDDAADAYVLAAKSSATSRGQIFNLVSYSGRIGDFVKAAASVIGYKGEISYFKPTDPFNEALSLSQQVLSIKANKQLGWTPRKLSLIEGIETYYTSWKARSPLDGSIFSCFVMFSSFILPLSMSPGSSVSIVNFCAL